MALMSLISKEFKTRIGSFTFDGTLEESATVEYQKSQYPRENRSLAIDNMARLPKKIRLKLIMTDTPNPSAAESLALTAGALAFSKLPPAVQGAVGSMGSIGIDMLTQGEARSAEAYQNLVAEANEMIAYDVMTEKALYTNMVITRIYTSNTHETQQQLIVDIDMEESPEYITAIAVPSSENMAADSIEAIQAVNIADLGRLA